MSTVHLLYAKEVPINQKINIRIPTVGEVIDNEDEYYALVSSFTAMPIDMMVQLDDIGVDFSKINDYELFLMMFGAIQEKDTSMIFGDLDLTKFEFAVNAQNGNVVLRDRENAICIDRAIHEKIAVTLRTIHHLEKDIHKPGNEDARLYMIEKERRRLRRQKNRQAQSHIEPLVVAMVNTEQFKYDYEGTRELSIYQFNESVRQIIKKVDYENLMHGVYAGTINAKELSQEELNWLSHK